MTMPIARKAARDVRGISIGMGLAVFALAVVAIALYPSFKDSFEDVDEGGALSGFVGETGSLSSPEGWAYGQYFAFIPVLLIVQAIISGSWAFAGEQGQGTMDLLLSQPITRRRLALEKALSLSLAIVIVALLAIPGFFVIMPFVDDFTVPYRRIVTATITMLPVSLLFLWFSLWLSAVAPTRAAAATVATAVAVVAYFLNFIGASADSLIWMQRMSPFYWSDASPALVGDFEWLHLLVVTLIGLAFLALAVRAFERRDISSGGREWKLLDVRNLFGRLPGRGAEQAQSS
jgi:ABC-2 type transport system permease protein